MSEYTCLLPEPDVIGHRLLVVTRHRARALAETAQIRCNHAIVARQPGDDVPPHEPRLRRALDEDDGGALAGRDIVDGHIAKLGETVFEPRSHCWTPPGVISACRPSGRKNGWPPRRARRALDKKRARADPTPMPYSALHEPAGSLDKANC